MKMKGSWISLFFVVFLLLPGVRGTSYSPGVSVGDWARYTVSGMTSSMLGMQNAGTMEVHVQSISGTNLSMSMITSGMMGGQTSHDGWFDMQQGEGSMDMMDMTTMMNSDMSMGVNMTMMSQGMMDSGMMNMSLFMAAGLSSGNPIFQGARFTINQTVMRNYLGVNREVNMLQIIRTYNGHPFNMTTYWDKSTGVMTECTITQTGSTQSISTQLSSTNLWGSLTVYPLGPFLAVALLLGFSLLAKRRLSFGHK